MAKPPRKTLESDAAYAERMARDYGYPLPDGHQIKRKRFDPLVLKAGNKLLPFADVDHVDIADVEREHIRIVMKDGSTHDAFGFDAIEGVMAIKPSALEGLRLKWRKNAWAFHNLAGHTGTQLLAWLGFKKAAIRWHDYTTPTPRGFKNTNG